jgi:hypothetical protein
VRQKLRPFPNGDLFSPCFWPLVFPAGKSTYSVTPWIFTVSVRPSVCPSGFSCNESTLWPLDECSLFSFFSVRNSAVFEISKFVRNLLNSWVTKNSKTIYFKRNHKYSIFLLKKMATFLYMVQLGGQKYVRIYSFFSHFW